MNHKEHNSRQFSDSQVLTTAIASAMFFRGNQSMALLYMKSHIFTNKRGLDTKD